MALPQEIRQKVDEKIMPFLKTGCPLCGNRKYFMNDDLFLHTVLDLKTKVQQQRGLYVVLATCKKCFLTMSFDTKRAGITDE